jgi:hypothetical protein
MYLSHGDKWPKADPITNRKICAACWYGLHDQCGKLFDVRRRIKCDHVKLDRDGEVIGKGCKLCKFECDCVHLSEATFAQEEKQRAQEARQAKRQLLHSMRDDPQNPLRAVNNEYEQKLRGNGA